MKFEKSEALKSKYKALYCLRLKQRCVFIATEVGPYAADVMGITEEKTIEVEVKTSLQDFKADFNKRKHYLYDNDRDINWEMRWIPNVFYFAVPSNIVEDCKKILSKKNRDKYGIIDADEWRVIKRAKKLHNREPSSKIKHGLALRMGSELLRFHEAWL